MTPDMIFTRPRKHREYVLLSERELASDAQTVFIIDDLVEQDQVTMMNMISGDGSDDPGLAGNGSNVHFAITRGLKGWRNAEFGPGDPVPFETHEGSSHPTDETLSFLSWEAKVELAGEILSATMPREEDTEK